MSGASKPSQVTIDPTNPRIAPLQDALAQAMMARLTGGQPQMPNWDPFGGSSIYSQLYGGGQAGPAAPPTGPAVPNPGAGGWRPPPVGLGMPPATDGGGHMPLTPPQMPPPVQPGSRSIRSMQPQFMNQFMPRFRGGEK
jgi:hypothetical protein